MQDGAICFSSMNFVKQAYCYCLSQVNLINEILLLWKVLLYTHDHVLDIRKTTMPTVNDIQRRMNYNVLLRIETLKRAPSRRL